MDFTYTAEKDTDLKSLLMEHGFTLPAFNRLYRSKETHIYINGMPLSDNWMLHQGDVVSFSYDFEESNVIPINKPIRILYEDEYILAVYKEKNLATMCTKAHSDDHLTGRVKHYFISTNQNEGIHLVSRLDYETQGIVLFAKSQYIHHLLVETPIEKIYTCHVHGKFDVLQGEIIRPIRREKPYSMIRVIDETGKYAHTSYEVIENGDISFVKLQLHTGRTHQIRVHMKSIGHPLVGDRLYSDGIGDFDLTCKEMTFTLSLNGKTYCIKADCN